MDAQTDKPTHTDWLQDALCRTLGDSVTWHWQEAPNNASAAPALSVCASCDVVRQCRKDMVEQGERYPYQVRGGLRHWLPDEHDQLPDSRLSPPKRQRPPGRPQGPLPGYRSKGYNYPPTGTTFNPHTRRPGNTIMPNQDTTER